MTGSVAGVPVQVVELTRPLHPWSAARSDSCVWRRGDEGLLTWGEVCRFEPGTGQERFARALVFLEEVLEPGDAHHPPVALASFTFDPEEPGSLVLVPAFVLRVSSAGCRLLIQGADDDWARALEPRGEGAREETSGAAVLEDPEGARRAFVDAVAEAAAMVRSRSLAKVVLARSISLRSPGPLDTALIARKLAARYPECFTFKVDGLVGASPELLVRLQERCIESLVLAGSLARGGNRAEDETLGERLLESHKDRVEHDLAVSSLSEALAPLVEKLAIEPRPSLFRLANVQHLATRVTATPAGHLDAHVLKLVEAAHPTAAVCGTPREEALRVIRKLEPQSRRRYAGPVGWLDAAGNGEFAIALRCAEISGAEATLFAGAGIVAESEPEAELMETDLKLQAMLSALPL